MRREFLDFVQDHLQRVEPLERRAALAWWDAAVGGEARAYRMHAALQSEIETLLADRERFALLERARASEEIRDPIERRLLDVLYRKHLARQTSADLLQEIVERANVLEEIHATHRAELDGRTVTLNEIREILSRSDDTALRRRAWEASKAVGPEVADGIRKLARLRNRAAADLGRPDYYRLALEISELEPAFLDSILDVLDARTRDRYRAIKERLDRGLAARFRIQPAELRLWHYEDPFFQEHPLSGETDLDTIYRDRSPVEIAGRFFEGIGLPVDAVLLRSDVEERKGKSPHAFSLDVDRKGDVRVLLNLRPNTRWMNATLHELGHATYDLGIRPALPYPLRVPAHAFTTESVAMMFGRLAEDASWIASMGLVQPSEAERLQGALQEHRARQHLVFARWCQVMVRFERLLYEDPDGDLEESWWRLVETYQEIPRPDGRRAPDWAAKIHVVAAPVYYQNYVLGELMSAQLEDALLRSIGADPRRPGTMTGRADAGRFLNERLFEPGASLSWDGLIETVTGGPLGVEAFVQRCAPA